MVSLCSVLLLVELLVKRKVPRDMQTIRLDLRRRRNYIN
jgi:hypothetical protein